MSDFLPPGLGDRIDDAGRRIVRAREVDITELRGLLHRADRETVALDVMEQAIQRRCQRS